MKLDTRNVAHGVRLCKWAEVLQEQKRSGQSIKSFCETQGISRQSFFYWQGKLREAACKELSERKTESLEAPSGWALCAMETKAPAHTTDEIISSTQMTMEVNGILITAGSEYPVEKLALLLRELMGGC